jgi:HEAT repeat protein
MAGALCRGYAGPVISPATDPRSASDLLDAALQADDNAAWNAVAALHWRGSKEVLDRAVTFTRSPDPALRGRGANILGQLGVPKRTFPEECFSAVLPLLGDNVESVVRDAVYALQHIDGTRASVHIIPFAGHANDDIRHAVAFGLGAVDAPEAHKALLTLMQDRNPDVRNWATFGIGQQSDADTDQIRAALASALSDDDDDVRYEGVIGLARRRDARAVPYLKLMLQDDPDDGLAQAAAARLLGLGEGEQVATAHLLGALQRLQRWRGRRTPPLNK